MPIITKGDVRAVHYARGRKRRFANSEHSALVQAAAMYFSKQMEE